MIPHLEQQPASGNRADPALILVSLVIGGESLALILSPPLYERSRCRAAFIVFDGEST